MDTAQIIQKAAQKLDIGEAIARRYLDTILSVVSEELQKGNDVSLTGFGDFCLEIQSGISKGSDGGRSGMKKAMRKVVFVPSGKLKNQVNRW